MTKIFGDNKIFYLSLDFFKLNFLLYRTAEQIDLIEYVNVDRFEQSATERMISVIEIAKVLSGDDSIESDKTVRMMALNGELLGYIVAEINFFLGQKQEEENEDVSHETTKFDISEYKVLAKHVGLSIEELLKMNLIEFMDYFRVYNEKNNASESPKKSKKRKKDTRDLTTEEMKKSVINDLEEIDVDANPALAKILGLK